MKKKLLLILVFLLLTTVTIREVCISETDRAAIKTKASEKRESIKIKKIINVREVSKNIKAKDYSKYIKVNELPSFKVPKIKYDSKEYDIELLPWGEFTKDNYAVGFQIKINF